MLVIDGRNMKDSSTSLELLTLIDPYYDTFVPTVKYIYITLYKVAIIALSFSVIFIIKTRM